MNRRKALSILGALALTAAAVPAEARGHRTGSYHSGNSHYRGGSGRGGCGSRGGAGYRKANGKCAGRNE